MLEVPGKSQLQLQVSKRRCRCTQLPQLCQARTAGLRGCQTLTCMPYGPRLWGAAPCNNNCHKLKTNENMQ